MRKINLYFLTLLFLIFSNPSIALDQELSDIVDTIDAAKNDFNNIDTSEVIEAVKMDEAFEQIDKVTEFVKESLEDGNEESAIKALEFIEKSLAGTNALVPQEFSSDMSKADIGNFGEDKMAVVNEITTEMKEVKEEKLNDLISGMVEISEQGLDTFGIVETLDQIGIETIDVAIAVEKKKEMATWTKEEWANSWKGDILTDDGKQIISDDEINTNISTLEQKLQVNNLEILDKKNSLNELQTKIDPLSGQITDLKTQKTDLLAKYNEEILKQSSTILSDEEINKSKELADQFNSQLSDLTDQIKTAEEQSNSLQEQVRGLNLELANDIQVKSQIQNNIKNLNDQLSINQNLFTKKELELDQLKNTDLNSKLTELNDQLETVSLQRDFAERDFNRALDKEVEAFQYYYSALGNVNADNYDIQAEYAVREVQAILNPDPKQYRAFEVEKYSKLVGFSQDFIDQGISAIENDDWDKQKSVFTEIQRALEKNPETVLPDGWYFGTLSNAEINVKMAEDKAIQEAVYASIELSDIEQNVNKRIAEKTENIQSLISLNTNFIRSASTYEGMAEHEPLMSEINKILENNEELKIKQNQIEEIQEEIKNFSDNRDNLYAEYQKQIQDATKRFQDIESQITQHNQNSDWRNPSWVATRQNLYNQRINMFYDRFAKFEDPTLEKTREINSLNLEIFSIKNNATTQARENLIAAVEDAKQQYDQIVTEESIELTEYKDKISNILKEIPTFEQDADLVVDLDPVRLRAKLVDLTYDGNVNELDAVETALKELGELGDKPVSQYMTGPYWEASNIKTAAMVRSKKYVYVDDYAYLNAYYDDPLTLSTENREELEGELKDVLGDSNVLIDALEAKANSLTNELNLTKEQSENLTTEISRLENELNSLKTSETEIQNQISDLSNQFSSKESLISEKTQNLASLQEQLNPLTDKMNELEGQRADLDAKLNTQLTTIANQIESQGQATDEANALKAQFENQLAQLDSQLKNYEEQSTEINSQLASLTTELTTLETETPDISNQISKLNQELNNVIEIKADLAMTQALKSGINVNEKIVEAVAKLENKSIVQIEGTELMRIVDTETLTDDVGDFEAPVGTFTRGNQVYLAGAVTREQILSVGKIDATGDLNIQLSQVAAEKINSGMFGLETAKGLVATDEMAEGTYSLIDPKTGRQVLDSHTGNALYGGIICSGDQCGPSGDLGKKVAASGYVFVRTGDINQGGMCSGGDCAFNISQSELETFNQQIADGVESPFGYDDALAAATINTKGLVLDSAISEAAGEVTKEFFSGKFSIMEDGGAEALLQKAKDAVTRLETAKASGQQVDENVLAAARNQVAAEQSVVDAVNAAKAASASTTQVASAATEAATEAASAAQEAAQEVTEIVQAAAHEVIDGVRAQKNVVQLVQNSDGSIHVIVGRTGVNVGPGQTVVYTGLTDAAANQGSACSSGNAAGCADHKKAVAEAEAASGLTVDGNPTGY